MSAFSGGISGPEDAMKRAQEMVAKAPTTMNVAATVFQKAVAEFQAAVAVLKGATAGGPGAPTTPTGPFTNIPGVPAMTGVPGISGSTGIVGEMASIGGMIGGPSVASTINRAGGIWGTISSLFSSLFGGGNTGNLILRGMGGVVPGHLIPLAAAANGGLFTSPTLALVAEAGEPELVVPKSKWREAFGSGGGETHVHFHVSTPDANGVAEFFHRHANTITSVISGQMGVNHPVFRQLRR